MKTNNIFTRFKKSIQGDKLFYKQIVNESFFKAFSYILIISLFLSIIFGIFDGVVLRNEVDKTLTRMESESFPQFSLENNTLTVESNEPIILNKSEKMIAIVDTTDTYSLNDLAGYDTGFLVTNERIIMSQVGLSPQALEFSQLRKDFKINNTILIQLLEELRKYTFLIVIIFDIFFTYFSLIVKIIFASLFGLIVKTFSRTNMKYSNMLKIIFYSFTLPLILIKLMTISPLIIPADIRQLLFFLIAGFYISRGIRVNAE
jgi:hypothetical protein